MTMAIQVLDTGHSFADQYSLMDERANWCGIPQTVVTDVTRPSANLVCCMGLGGHPKKHASLDTSLFLCLHSSIFGINYPFHPPLQISTVGRVLMPIFHFPVELAVVWYFEVAVSC